MKNQSNVILIKDGRVLDSKSKTFKKADLLIIDGKIERIAVNLADKSARVIEASGQIVCPGFIDMHVHLREPGREDKETIASGTRAAARGGFTSVCCMANTNPAIDTPAVVNYVISKARSEGVVNVFPIGAVTKGLKGEEIAEMGLMRQMGAAAFSDDGNPIMNATVLRHALEYLRGFDIPVICHSEDLTLSNGGYMNEGYTSTILGLKGIPALAEETAVARDIALAAEFGRIHIAHVSTAGSVELIRRAKKKKIPVTAETCPHYFALTEDAVKNYDTNTKMNPPLRSKHDVKAILAGLKDGTIDVIATDHAPHTFEEKNVEYSEAPFGIVGLETALPLIISRLVEAKVLTLAQALAKITLNPAKILGLKKGKLAAGLDADITIIDPAKKVVIDKTKFASLSKNTPFDGWKLNGAVETVIVGGKIVVENGKLIA